jgi:hypothetical protein
VKKLLREMWADPSDLVSQERAEAFFNKRGW